MSVGLSVRRSVSPSVPLYFFGVFELFEGRIARVLVLATAQLISAPAQLITAPAQPPATGQSCIRPCFGIQGTFENTFDTVITLFSVLNLFRMSIV